MVSWYDLQKLLSFDEIWPRSRMVRHGELIDFFGQFLRFQDDPAMQGTDVVPGAFLGAAASLKFLPFIFAGEGVCRRCQKDEAILVVANRHNSRE